MNSLALFHFPLKVGHVPKRLAGVAIVGGSTSIGESGGVGRSGSFNSFGSSLDFSKASSNSSSKGSVFLSCSSGSCGSGSSHNFPCATKDSSAKGLNTDSETWSLESVSC
jgi:hypothetical protein